MKTVRCTLVALYYLILQTIVSAGLIIWKINIDPYWYEILLRTPTASEALSLISELLLPALLISDIIIVIPLLIKSKFKIFKKLGIKDVIDLVAIGLFCNYVISYFVSLLQNFSFANSYNELMSFTQLGNPILIVIAAGILAPMVEELCFRYWMFDICKTKSDTFKIILTAFLFGLAHLNIIQSSYAFLLGLLLGYVYAKTKNIWAPMTIHIAINLSSSLYEVLPSYGALIIDALFIVSLIYVPVSLIRKKNILIS